MQSAIIRRYFLELTQSFLIPLERYLASLMPLQRNISPFKAAPLIEPFNPDDFLKSLETSGPQLTTGIKGDWAGLYKKFFLCRNFYAWYESRYKEVSRKLEALHVKAISEASLTDFVQNKAEIEIVDLVLQLKDKIRAVENGLIPVPRDTIDKLRLLFQGIISSLPPDLQSIFSLQRH